MRIALVNSEHPSRGGHGGIATYTFTLANALAARGDTVHVYLRKGMPPDPMAENVKIHMFDYLGPSLARRLIEMVTDRGPFRWEKGFVRSIAAHLAATHRQRGLDLAEFPDWGGLANDSGAADGFPLIINFHTPSEMVDSLNRTPLTKERKKWHGYEEKAIRKAGAYRCPSEAIKSYACKRYAIPASAVTVIRNPVSTKLFDKVKKNYPALENHFDLLFAGRLEYRKGIEIVAEHLREILRLDSKITITFAGESVIGHAPDYRVKIENSLSDEERQRVWFVGPVQRSELVVLYCRSTMLLLPSLFENAPYALLEAMASRLPVIGAATGGIGEIIQHGKNGLLFPIDNSEKLISCIDAYIKNPALAKSCAEQAYADVKTLYSPEKIAAESAAFYESLIHAKRP